MIDVIHMVRRKAALKLLDALASVGYFSEMVRASLMASCPVLSSSRMTGSPASAG